MGRKIEGLWDCECCSTKGIKGRYRDCPNCGSPRDKNTEFYLPNNITDNYVDETEVKISSGPDWTCPYCDSLNSSDIDTCSSCGASKNESKENYFTNKEKKVEVSKEEEPFEEEEMSEETYEDAISTLIFQELYEKKRNTSSGIWKIVLSVILGIALIIGGIFLLSPKEKDVTITSFEWERYIDIEDYKAVEESGRYLPEGARLHYYTDEVVDTTKVIIDYETEINEIERSIKVGTEERFVGYEDLGNGYFEEIYEEYDIYDTYIETEVEEVPVYIDEPIYATVYYYEVDKWSFSRSVKTRGTDKNAYWGDVELKGKERESGKREFYYIHVKDEDGEKEKLSIDYNEWKKLNAHQTIKVKVNFLGEATIVS